MRADALVYPLGLRVRGRLAVVVGGGALAERRVASLLTGDADVMVVAPALSPLLDGLAAGGRITARRRGYVAGDLGGAWLVLACTGDPQADAAVAADAEGRRIWCASGDDAAASLAWVPDEGQPDGGRPVGGRPVGGRPGGRRGAGADVRGGAGAGAGRFASSGYRVLVLGGARSGKSVTAEEFLAEHPHVDYLAAGPPPDPGDAEWHARVLVHRQRRPAGWRTIETLDVERELTAAGAAGSTAAGGAGGTAPGEAGGTAPVLVDCLSTWLAGVMDDCGIWTGLPDADQALARRTSALVAAWRATGRYAVAVSSEVGSGVVPGTVAGRRFRDELGSLNARIAAECDEVWLCTAGIARRLR